MTRSGECVVSPAKAALAIGEGEYLVPFLAQQLGNHLQHREVVIYQEDFGHEAKVKPNRESSASRTLALQGVWLGPAHFRSPKRPPKSPSRPTPENPDGPCGSGLAGGSCQTAGDPAFCILPSSFCISPPAGDDAEFEMDCGTAADGNLDVHLPPVAPEGRGFITADAAAAVSMVRTIPFSAASPNRRCRCDRKRQRTGAVQDAGASSDARANAKRLGLRSRCIGTAFEHAGKVTANSRHPTPCPQGHRLSGIWPSEWTPCARPRSECSSSRRSRPCLPPQEQPQAHQAYRNREYGPGSRLGYSGPERQVVQRPRDNG